MPRALAVRITGAPSLVNDASPFRVFFRFNMPGSGFEATDVEVSNGSISELDKRSRQNYAAFITPSGAGNVTINVPADVAQSDDESGTYNTAADPVTVEFTGGTDLSVGIVADPATVLAGSQLTYTVTVNNGGPQTAASPEVTVTLPDGVTFDSANSASTCTANQDRALTLICSLSDIDSGISTSFEVVVDVDNETSGTITALARVTSTTADTMMSNNEASVDVTVNEPTANLSVGIAADPATVLAGSELTYTVTVENEGLQTAYSTTLSVALPDGLNYVGSSVFCSQDSNGDLTCPLGDLPNGYNGSPTIYVTVDGDMASGSINTEVTVESDTSDPDPDNNSDTENTNVRAREGSLVVAVATAPAAAGDATFSFYSSSHAELDGLSLTTVSNAASSASFTLSAGTIELRQEELDTWELGAVSCEGDEDNGTLVTLSDGKVMIDLDHDETIVCTFTNSRASDYVITRTSRIIRNFMSRRADTIVASEPNLIERLSRNGGSDGRGVEGAFNLSHGAGQSRLNFSAYSSMSHLLNAQAVNLQNALDMEASPQPVNEVHGKTGTYGLLALPEQKRQAPLPQQVLAYADGQGETKNVHEGWDVWVRTTLAHTEDDTGSATVGLLHFGVDYLYDSALVVGLGGQIDWIDDTHKDSNVGAEGLGWMVGPYMAKQLNDNLFLDARAVWVQSSNSVKPFGTYEDDFDTDRWLVRSQLTGQFEQGDTRISPHLRVVYFEETQHNYTDSLANIIPEQTISLGHLSFGPTFSTRRVTETGLLIEPSVGLHGIWIFDPADTVDIDTGIVSGSEAGVRARIEAGLSMLDTGNRSFSLNGFYDGIGSSDVQSYGAMGHFRMPLN
ncbi:MAG: prealbumin-like fold domain-containing protein [Rhizobiaceae bacterium]